jgi:tellurite resistance protein TehA-like permease
MVVTGRKRRPTPIVQVLMLLAVLGIVGVALAALGSVVLLPQGGALVFIVAAAVLFLGTQLALFRWLGLRSEADETGVEPPHDEPGDDWRAWRG